MDLNKNEVIYYYSKYVPVVNINVHTDPSDVQVVNIDDYVSTDTYNNNTNTYNNSNKNVNTNVPSTSMNNKVPSANQSTNTSKDRTYDNQVIAVANTGQNAKPIYLVSGAILVMIGAMIIIIYKKKTRKVFYI